MDTLVGNCDRRREGACRGCSVQNRSAWVDCPNTQPRNSRKLRVSRAVLEHLMGSTPWEQPDKADPADARWAQKLKNAKPRKDGSVTIEIDDPEELFGFRIYIDCMVDGAKDNLGFDPFNGPDTSALAEYNSGNALLRAIDKQK